MLTSPYIASIVVRSLSGKAKATAYQVARGRSMMKDLHRRLNIGGVTVGRDIDRLEDGALVEARVSGPINKIIITTALAAARLVKPKVSIYVPDFVSGFLSTSSGDVSANPPVQMTFYPDSVTRNGWPNTYGQAAIDAPGALNRFAITRSDSQGNPINEYRYRKPGDFSGRIRRLIQLFYGYGRQDKPSLFDISMDAKVKGGQPVKPAPTFWDRYKRYASSDGGIPLPFYTKGSPATCGLHVDDAGNSWVIVVGTAVGLVAYALPLHEDTTASSAFFEGLGRLSSESGQPFSDPSAFEVVKEYGGIPLCLGVDDRLNFADFSVAAGYGVRFFNPSTLPFSASDKSIISVNYVFNDRGNSIVATVVRKASDSTQKVPKQKISHYQIDFSLQNFSRPTGRHTDKQNSIGNDMASLLENYSYDLHTQYAVWYKARYLTEDQAQEVESTQKNDSAESAYGKFINYPVPSKPKGSYSISLKKEVTRYDIFNLQSGGRYDSLKDYVSEVMYLENSHGEFVPLFEKYAAQGRDIPQASYYFKGHDPIEFDLSAGPYQNPSPNFVATAGDSSSASVMFCTTRSINNNESLNLIYREYMFRKENDFSKEQIFEIEEPIYDLEKKSGFNLRNTGELVTSSVPVLQSDFGKTNIRLFDKIVRSAYGNKVFIDRGTEFQVGVPSSFPGRAAYSVPIGVF